MPDQTFKELEPQCLVLLSKGHTFWAKFTCQHCGARQTSDQKNVFHESYYCEECGEISTPGKYGLIILMTAK